MTALRFTPFHFVLLGAVIELLNRSADADAVVE